MFNKFWTWILKYSWLGKLESCSQTIYTTHKAKHNNSLEEEDMRKPEFETIITLNTSF